MMSKSMCVWLMIANGAFIVLNTFFMVILENSVVNLVAALVSVFGFACALSMYLHVE